MPSEPRVAVILPCYEQAHFLAEALTSLAGQTHRPAEVVVVDDGSSDDVAAAAAPFPWARVLRQENQGVAAARNRGAAEVSAPFVVFLDSDDRLLPNALATNVAALEAHPAAAFAWGFNRPFVDEDTPLPWGATSFDGEATYARLLESNEVGAPLGVMFRRELLVAAGGFSTEFPACEDYEIYLRLAREHPFVCVQEVIAEYRHHTSNMSSDRQLIYESALAVRADQDRWVKGDPVLEAALARGRRDARLRYDALARLDTLGGHLTARRWGAAIWSGVDLFARHPGFMVRTALQRWTG